MRIKKQFILGFCLMILGLWAQAQPAPRVIKLDIAAIMDFLDDDVLAIQELNERLKLAQVKAAKEKSWWLPTLSGGFNLHQLNGIAMNTDGRYFTDLNRQNYFAGLGLDAEWDFATGPDRARLAEAATKGLELASETERMELLQKAGELYFALAAEDARMRSQLALLVRAESIVQQLAIQVEGGMRYKSELLLAKSNLNHTKLGLLRDRENYQSIGIELAGLFNLEGQVTFTIRDSLFLPVDLVENPAFPQIKPNVYAKQPAYQQLNAATNLIEIRRKSYQKALLRPTLRLNIQEGIFGNPFFFHSGANQFQVNGGLVWRLPLERMFHNRQLEEMDIEMQVHHTMMEQLRFKVNRDLDLARHRIRATGAQIALAREGMSLSQEALSQSIERQKLGTARAFEVFQAQEYYARARMDLIEATKRYNQAQWTMYLLVKE
ncbi:MAG TPA: TolC family protein [Bacteroidetes bacterium]|nr:TolC family protein [Bacteroidota bacterium]